MNLAQGRVVPGRGLSLALVACCVLAVAGCGSAGAGDDLGGRGGHAQGATATGTASRLPSEAEALARWRAWEPTTKVVAREYSEDEAARMRLEWLEENRPDAAAGLPVPELVAWSQVDDQPVADCMTQAGFPATQIDPAGGIEQREVSESQQEASDVALWTCMARHTPSAARIAGWGKLQFAVLYEYFTTFYLDCVAELGYELDRTQVPSQETWVAQAMQGEAEGLWWPAEPADWPSPAAGVLRAGGPQAETVLSRTCPRRPPAAVMFGEEASLT